MKHFFYILVATLFLNACTGDFFSQTVKIDPPEYEKQLSFHLLSDTKDSSIRIVMTRSYGLLEELNHSDEWYVHGASAELYENGQPWVTLQPVSVDSGFMLMAELPHAFQAGSTYEIRASHPDFPSVRAVQVVPGDFQVDSVRVRYDAVPGEFGDRFDLAEVFLQDQPGVKNYYEIMLSSRYAQVVYDPFTNTYDTLAIQTYPLYIEGFNDPNAVYGYANGGLINDQFFDGQAYKFQVRFSSYDSTTLVTIRSVTEDYYKWSRSYQSNYESEGNPLVEPITIFHNLENGLGIFSVAQEQRFEVH